MLEKIVKQAQKGDKKAFELIIKNYHKELYKIARTRLNTIEDIEDVIQETIFSAYKSINKLKNPSKTKSWLITILINECNDYYKRKKSSVSLEEIEAENYIPCSSQINSNVEFDNLMSLLNKDERTILVLYYSDGYKTNEIGNMLNINDSTVRNIMQRAKKKIEKNVKEDFNYG